EKLAASEGREEGPDHREANRELLREREPLVHPEPPHQDRDDRVRRREGHDDRDRTEPDRQENCNPGDAKEEQRRNRLADPGTSETPRMTTAAATVMTG